MKKIMTSILGVALALSMTSMAALAAVPVCERHFTDADGDGLCDYCSTACRFVDEDGNGLCDGCGFDRHGMDTVCSAGFLDDDGDGICDNCHVGRHGAGTCGTGYAETSGSTPAVTCQPARTSHHGSHHLRSGRHCH